MYGYFFLDKDIFFRSNKDSNNMWHVVKEENMLSSVVVMRELSGYFLTACCILFSRDGVFGKIDPSLRTDGSNSSSSRWSPLAVTNLTSLFWKKRLWSFRLMLSNCRRGWQILFLAYGNGP
ncbi:hypothetical protein T11_3793 [Trichinella zimbabwensis]|uniref:Uncharacterized protein n=1 Tax=Trichinella zimbabwensis TaxID=268475 RepID=A0A0V1H4Y1_9BILA|nr:hypothetical protein T11_3793 [Trichinella zimbabwensis]